MRGKTVAVLGLTFKPNTDDMRDAPSIPLITALHDMGAKVRAYDPVGMEQAKKVLPDLTYCADEYDCANGAAALVICTEWEQFRALDLGRLKEVMGRPPPSSTCATFIRRIRWRTLVLRTSALAAPCSQVQGISRTTSRLRRRPLIGRAEHCREHHLFKPRHIS